MIEQAHKTLYRVSTSFLTFGGRSVTIREVVTPSPPCMYLQKVILILWFFVLTAVHMLCIDNAIAADPNVPGPILVLRQPDISGFDRELFASNGSNISESFDSGNYFQANFRLARSEGGENLISDWDTFRQIVNSLKSAADSMHGIPLLITKATFMSPQPTGEPSATRTFFMAALAAKTIFHRQIRILSSPALHLSVDPVKRIQLQVEGSTVEIDPAGDTPVQFLSDGEKIILATVQFASGFVGQNLFRVVVDSE
jgi:hypothetical protein